VLVNLQQLKLDFDLCKENEQDFYVSHDNYSSKLTSLNKDVFLPSCSFTFIDLFAGIGGFRIAFQNLGGKCIFSSEIDRYSRKTYQINFGETPHGDITLIPAADIPDHDVLTAGFPCQAFSQKILRIIYLIEQNWKEVVLLGISLVKYILKKAIKLHISN
jgi:hypothetical protein